MIARGTTYDPGRAPNKLHRHSSGRPEPNLSQICTNVQPKHGENLPKPTLAFIYELAVHASNRYFKTDYVKLC